MNELSFTIYGANVLEQSNNTFYRNALTISDRDTLASAVGHDYVCAAYKNGYRSNDNFLHADCLALDCDSDHSERNTEWVTPEDVHQQFPDVPLAIHYSRNHMKAKGKKMARPRFHCLFPIEDTCDPEAYKAMKLRMNEIFPYFDVRALDSAHFFYGTKDANVEFHPGTITLNECLDSYYPKDSFADMPDNTPGERRIVIQEGSRNRTLSMFAGKILKRYGDTENTHEMFLQEATKCDPPLDDRELNTIWRSARGFYQRISCQPDYVPSERYNKETPNDFVYRPADDSDIREARMLANVYYERLRYSRATDYLCYDGICWNEDIPGAHRIVHELTDLQLAEAEEAMNTAWQVLKGNGGAELLETLSPKKALAAMNVEQQKALAWYNVTKSITSLR